jgi:SagB-type dehydrogenase family enzyme
MRRRSLHGFSAFVVLLAMGAVAAYAQEAQTVKLPAPRTEGGKPLMQALKERRSTREFSPEKLPLQVLSDLLWAAFGINRETGQRTAPSANNRQEIDIYIATAEGLYLYEAKGHEMRRVSAEDVRALTGTQEFVKQAPINLVYVADLAKGKRTRAEDIEFYSGANTGFIAQNVYLFCASEGLACVVRALVNREALAKAMGLRPDQKITLAQTVGYPKK